MKTWKKIVAIILMAMVLVIILNGCNKESSHVVDSTTEALLSNCRLEVTEFFDERGIDISKKISTIKNTYVYKQSDADASGYYETDTGNLYLEESAIEDENTTRYVYIHMLMYYLLVPDGSSLITEFIADTIADDILGYSLNSDDVMQGFCHQILIADPDIIEYMIRGGVIDNRIDKRLSSSLIRKNHIKYSEILDVLLKSITFSADTLGVYSVTSSIEQSQAIISAYCESFELSAEQRKKLDLYVITDISIVP